ncbi:MAG: hypothetical protein Q9181_002948 [Wetmoreana brouardii]
MTVEKCAASCNAFTYFGVEYGRECYCGNSLSPGSVNSTGTDCKFPCPGNSAETCGAGNRLDLYRKTTTAPSASQSSPISPSYASQGCYTEATKGRALIGKTYYDNALTIEKCATACNGYNYFGLEYYRECYCGDDLQDGSVPASSTECKYACTGDSSELCGGDYRLNLYSFGRTVPSSTASTTSGSSATPSPSTFTSTGCYTEGSESRALTGAVFYDDKMTTEKCAAVCTGFSFFGTEYARECYCGNVIQAGSVQAPASECSTLDFYSECLGHFFYSNLQYNVELQHGHADKRTFNIVQGNFLSYNRYYYIYDSAHVILCRRYHKPDHALCCCYHHNTIDGRIDVYESVHDIFRRRYHKLDSVLWCHQYITVGSSIELNDASVLCFPNNYVRHDDKPAHLYDI